MDASPSSLELHPEIDRAVQLLSRILVGDIVNLTRLSARSLSPANEGRILYLWFNARDDLLPFSCRSASSNVSRIRFLLRMIFLSVCESARHVREVSIAVYCIREHIAARAGCRHVLHAYMAAFEGRHDIRLSSISTADRSCWTGQACYGGEPTRFYW